MRFLQGVLVLLAAFIGGVSSYATTYYVSPAGSDSASGKSTSSPWKTIAKVNAASLSSGDQVLFLRGGVWRDMLVPNGSGLYFGAYGTGARPVISGSDVLSGSWTRYSGNTCSKNVGGSDLTEVWINGVLGSPVTSASAIIAPGDWFYGGGTLYVNFKNGCSTTLDDDTATSLSSTTGTVEITRRPYALLVDNIGAITVEHLAFVNGMYNSINLGSHLVGVQTFNDVVWKGARYEGFIASSGAPMISGSEGLYSLSGLTAAGGNGFTLTNSILSGNQQDAIEVYGTSGASTIQSSTISGNATTTATTGTINNWSSYPLTADNSILLPNPFLPSLYSFTGVTDDGTNIETSPIFSKRAAPLIIVPFIDDYINLSVAESVAAVAKTYGCPISYAINTKLVTTTDWARIAALQSAGNEIVAHTRSHSDLANNNVFTLSYTGPATSATVTLDQTAGTLQTYLNGSSTPDLVVPILDKWNSVQNMCASINAKTGYSCVVQDNQLYFTPLNLANVAGANIIPGYMMTASSNYLNWEVEGSGADIAANIPGYKATSFATPFTSSNQVVENHIKNAGFLINRNGTVDSNLQPNGNWLFSSLDVYNMAAEWLPNAFDKTQPAGSIGALIEGLGAAGGVFAIYSHGYDEFSLAQWTQLFQLMQKDGATCETMSQARSYITSHGTLVQDGTGKRWVMAVPLNPVFSNTPSSPSQGAHGLN